MCCSALDFHSAKCTGQCGQAYHLSSEPSYTRQGALNQGISILRSICWRSPVFFMGKSDLRCTVEGSSFMRSESCLLKGEVFWPRAGKPRKEPCRARASTGAWRRGMTRMEDPLSWDARGPPGSGGEEEQEEGEEGPPT